MIDPTRTPDPRWLTGIHFHVWCDYRSSGILGSCTNRGLTMRCSDSTGLGNPEKDSPEVKVWRIAKPSVWAHASQLLPGHRITVAIVASRGPGR